MICYQEHPVTTISKVRRARKAHHCRCGTTIKPGTQYRYWLCFPGDSEVGNTGFWRGWECADCCERYGRPVRAQERRSSVGGAGAVTTVNITELRGLGYRLHAIEVPDDAELVHAAADELERLRAEGEIATVRVHPGAGGVGLIAAERQRQIDSEGWAPEHDDDHDGFELSGAARCYTIAAEAVLSTPNNVTFTDFHHGRTPSDWPWAVGWWKPSNDPIRNLVKAGALIAAEIDRLARRAAASEGGT